MRFLPGAGAGGDLGLITRRVIADIIRRNAITHPGFVPGDPPRLPCNERQCYATVNGRGGNGWDIGAHRAPVLERLARDFSGDHRQWREMRASPRFSRALKNGSKAGSAGIGDELVITGCGGDPVRLRCPFGQAPVLPDVV